MRKFFIQAACALLYASLLSSLTGIRAVHAAGMVVNSDADAVANDGFCTLREAILNANHDDQSGSIDCPPGSGADSITFAANYTIRLADRELPAVTSVIRITGNGQTNTLLLGSAYDRVFEVSNSGNLTIDHLSFGAGHVTTITPNSGSGGGGLFNAGVATITNSRVSSNTSAFGGGISNSGTLTIIDSDIKDNTGWYEGGGLYLYPGGTVTIMGGNISNNKSLHGAGICNRSKLVIQDSNISNNSTLGLCGSCSLTTSGGGIESSGDLILTNVNITANKSASGGGIEAGGHSTLMNVTIAGNVADFTSGGGFLNGGVSTITNVTFSGNTAVLSGGGLENGGKATLTNVTIAGNSAGSGSGIAGSGTLTLTNVILSGGLFADPARTVMTYSIQGNPGLGALQNNGGFTPTMALQPGSSAIDAGSQDVCLPTDQRGIPRPQGAGCDIGAYELEVGGTYPTVLSTSVHSRGEAGPGLLSIAFSENVFAPSGNRDSHDVTNPANYLLIEKGRNGLADTSSCRAGLAADDTRAPTGEITYDPGSHIAMVTLPGNLPDGSYRFFVCGTTSIVDLSGNKLNNGVSDYTFDFKIPYHVEAAQLPSTGFAPHTITSIPAQPAGLAYSKLGDIWLEIPALHIKTGIAGVPKTNNTWDVSWLGENSGWLHGTAFPSWEGNSVITGHVYGANGVPGPFWGLKNLKYGDRVIIHLSGQQYIFEVQSSRLADPGPNAYAFQHLERTSYLTLITCQGYDEKSDSYRFRRIVRAVLVEVKEVK